MRIAAVLVTHNRPQLLLQALAALRAQTRPLDAIYVVDNGSDPPCMPGEIGATNGLGGVGGVGGVGVGVGVGVGRVSGRGDCSDAGAVGGTGVPDSQERVTLLRSDMNLGGAGGFALGMARAFAAGHDWIWLLDDDAMARPDALAQLLGALEGHGSSPGPGPGSGIGIGAIGALCGTVREFGDIALRHRRRYHLPTGIELPLPRAAYDGPPCRVDTASFVGFLVAASAIAEVGMPERGFFLGYDDTEYALRLGRAGRPVWLVPGSVVEHLRARRARLRAGPFGVKHYFTIRNRIAVARAYATLPLVPTLVALLFGLALWTVSGGRLRRGAVSVLMRAIGDGVSGRLGPFPETLARLQARPTGPPQSSANPPQASAGPPRGTAGLPQALANPPRGATGPPQGSTDTGPGRA